MQRSLLFSGVILLFTFPSSGQIGKSVVVQAGTPEDHALSQIYAAQEPAQKIALLDKFMAEYGKGDMALLADELYADAYLAEKDYDKALEYGEKALAVDPNSLATAVTLARAAEAKGDTAKLFDLGEQVAGILTRYKASPAPAGVPEKEWEQEKAGNLQKVQADVNYVEYALYSAAYKTPDPSVKAGLFARFGAAFPDSSYAKNAEEELAFAYQQTQNYPQMLDTAQKVLAADSNNVSMLLLLADYYSERGEKLSLAETDSKKSLDLLAAATKPDNLSDEQWQQQVSLQKGLAYSALGQVYVNEGRNIPAVQMFKQASPLLKSNTVTYARNLYRLGFTLAKTHRTVEAREVLTEAVSLNSPYRALAEQTLNKIGGPLRRTRRH